MSGERREIERFVMRVLDHRKESTGEEWSALHETPHPDGQWVRYSDHLSALQEERERREAAEKTLDSLQEVREGEMNVVVESRERAEKAEERLREVEEERDTYRSEVQALNEGVRRAVELRAEARLEAADKSAELHLAESALAASQGGCDDSWHEDRLAPTQPNPLDALVQELGRLAVVKRCARGRLSAVAGAYDHAAHLVREAQGKGADRG